MDIMNFDLVEDAFNAEENAREAADSRTTDEQKELKKGDYFMKDSGYGFPIFGKVLKEYKKGHMKNYRFCECYSIGCPYGEKGDVHVSTIGYRIDEKLFNKFKEKGWKID